MGKDSMALAAGFLAANIPATRAKFAGSIRTNIYGDADQLTLLVDNSKRVRSAISELAFFGYIEEGDKARHRLHVSDNAEAVELDIIELDPAAPQWHSLSVVLSHKDWGLGRTAKGYAIKNGVLYNTFNSTPRVVNPRSESEVYAALNLPYIPPYLRHKAIVDELGKGCWQELYLAIADPAQAATTYDAKKQRWFQDGRMVIVSQDASDIITSAVARRQGMFNASADPSENLYYGTPSTMPLDWRGLANYHKRIMRQGVV